MLHDSKPWMQEGANHNSQPLILASIFWDFWQVCIDYYHIYWLVYWLVCHYELCINYVFDLALYWKIQVVLIAVICHLMTNLWRWYLKGLLRFVPAKMECMLCFILTSILCLPICFNDLLSTFTWIKSAFALFAFMSLKCDIY